MESLNNVIQDRQAVWKIATPPPFNASNVEINADKREVNRLIAEFIAMKRRENDELNVQEFCNRLTVEETSELSCARIDSAVKRRDGCHGHIKVSKVVNEWGPQTMPFKLQNPSPQIAVETSREDTQSQLPQGIEERLANMEEHCNINAGNPHRKNVYERFNYLDDYILFLEGLFPEYLNDYPRKLDGSLGNDKRQLPKPLHEDMSLDELNTRIKTLQEGLVKRSTKSENCGKVMLECQDVFQTAPDLLDNVQIKADKIEIQRRIAKFIARKRKENDELNVQKFIKRRRPEIASEFSCARVDAVVVQRSGSSSPFKVNECSPQTMDTTLQQSTSQEEEKTFEEETKIWFPQLTDECLTYSEKTLNITEGKPVGKIIYEHLKYLEDRILFLENLSPMYFRDLPYELYQRIKKDKHYLFQPWRRRDLGVDEINARMKTIRKNLLKRSAGPMT